MSPSSVLPFVGLAALGALVELDERGLFAGILRTPVLVGALTGWVVGHAALGLAIGIVFALLWPAPFRSGGHRDPSPGIAALVGAAAVALPTVDVRVGTTLRQIFAETGNADLGWGVLVGAGGAYIHHRIETKLRSRFGRAEGEPSIPAALRTRAWGEALLLGAAIGVVAGLLGEAMLALRFVERSIEAGWDGGAWHWIVLAAFLGVASQFGRSRGKITGVREWAIGVGLGAFAVVLFGSVW
ncbi:MAG: hypothetical protein KDA27_04440 [Candidatus Eisenbacteria bacterium]|uniref:Uncharacterized protein n=1 Tax=Eiseniibacteriota bacterium TaxID=2212470 RepID=A0A956SD37_UNCEI|nr:hypothetical protein [Candidatus Eisenbacteria bacterium]MCB9462551.1 hypothetical protein [Candidatus Eisenbacteria bacterium]